jgi:hypothetical protein
MGGRRSDSMRGRSLARTVSGTWTPSCGSGAQTRRVLSLANPHFELETNVAAIAFAGLSGPCDCKQSHAIHLVSYFRLISDVKRVTTNDRITVSVCCLLVAAVTVYSRNGLDIDCEM